MYEILFNRKISYGPFALRHVYHIVRDPKLWIRKRWLWAVYTHLTSTDKVALIRGEAGFFCLFYYNALPLPLNRGFTSCGRWALPQGFPIRTTCNLKPIRHCSAVSVPPYPNVKDIVAFSVTSLAATMPDKPPRACWRHYSSLLKTRSWNKPKSLSFSLFLTSSSVPCVQLALCNGYRCLTSKSVWSYTFFSLQAPSTSPVSLQSDAVNLEVPLIIILLLILYVDPFPVIRSYYPWQIKI